MDYSGETEEEVEARTEEGGVPGKSERGDDRDKGKTEDI